MVAKTSISVQKPTVSAVSFGPKVGPGVGWGCHCLRAVGCHLFGIWLLGRELAPNSQVRAELRLETSSSSDSFRAPCKPMSSRRSLNLCIIACTVGLCVYDTVSVKHSPVCVIVQLSLMVVWYNMAKAIRSSTLNFRPNL